MNSQPQILQPWPGVVCWNVYSPGHRVDLSCTAVSTASHILVFDPLPAALDHFKSYPTIIPIPLCLTSGNHLRIDTANLDPARIPLFIPRGSELGDSIGTQFDPDQFPVPGWRAFPLLGGGPGETAFYLAERSLMVFGDAVVHLPGRGLEILPSKYCSNQDALRAAVVHLTNSVSFEHAVFAHGSPLAGNAWKQIREMAGRSEESDPDSEPRNPGLNETPH